MPMIPPTQVVPLYVPRLKSLALIVYLLVEPEKVRAIVVVLQPGVNVCLVLAMIV